MQEAYRLQHIKYSMCCAVLPPWLGYPPILTWPGGTPLSWPGWGVPWGPPVWGTPPILTWPRIPWGTPLAGPGWGTPIWTWLGYGPAWLGWVTSLLAAPGQGTPPGWSTPPAGPGRGVGHMSKHNLTIIHVSCQPQFLFQFPSSVS